LAAVVLADGDDGGFSGGGGIMDSESTDTDAPIYWLGTNRKVAKDYTDFYDGSWDGGNTGTNEDGTDANELNHPYLTGSRDDGTGFPGHDLGQSIVAGGLVRHQLSNAGRSAAGLRWYSFLAMSPVFKVQSPGVTVSKSSVTVVEEDLYGGDGPAVGSGAGGELCCCLRGGGGG